MSSWESAKRASDDYSNQTNKFLRLQNDGDKVIVAFVSEPHMHGAHRLDGAARPENCSGPGCKHCQRGNKPNYRFALNAFVPNEGKMRILDATNSTFKSILALHEKYGFEKNLFEITRRGRPNDPKTLYQILPDAPITPEVAEKIKAAQLHDLTKLGREPANGDGLPV